MIRRLSLPAVLTGLALLTMTAAPLAAQYLLFTEYKDQLLPVVRAHDTRPYVEVAGKQVAADGHRFALREVDEYMPVYIFVKNLEVSTSHLEMGGSEMNHEFRLRGWLETPYWLDDVFIVLELDMERGGKMIFLSEVGDLSPRHAKLLSLRVPMAYALGAGRYQMHLFSKGMEVLQTDLNRVHTDAVLDRMTLKRIADVKDAPPKLFMGPQPEYPAALLKARTRGQAIISVRIGATGRVSDETVKSATDPEFGRTALAAVQMWRFLPRVVKGQPVETLADLPIAFSPPEPAAKRP